jgi:hypothetical protein
MKTIFKMGQVLVTYNSMAELNIADIARALARYGNCDWGDSKEEDVESNELAITNNEQIFAAYCDKQDMEFFIVTEADRSTTTVTLPNEYPVFNKKVFATEQQKNTKNGNQ